MEDLQDVPLAQRVAAVETGFGRGRGMKRQRADDAAPKGRKDRNAPMEVSSKRRVPLVSQEKQRAAPKARDPRFDSTAGTFKEEHFRKAYGFVDDLRNAEFKELAKKSRKTKDPEQRRVLQYQMSRLKQAVVEGKRGDVAREALAKARKAEREAVAAGKRAYYMKSKDSKALVRSEQMAALRAEGGEKAVRRFETKVELRKGKRGGRKPKLGGGGGAKRAL